jgi:hypothetical protein
VILDGARPGGDEPEGERAGPGGPVGPDLVDAYLDQLVVQLRLNGEDVRRVLAEVEDHLREATDAERARGLEVAAAQQAAIDRFGSPREVARRLAAERGRLLPASVLVNVAMVLVLVFGIALLAIGASGVVAAGLGSAFGKDFVAGDGPGVTYTPERCADFFEQHPTAADCASAAVAHHYDELVYFRLDAGVVGAVILAGWAYVRRRYPFGAGFAVLPAGFTPTIGTALFGAAGLVLGGLGIAGTLTPDRSGAGSNLSGGMVAIAIATAFGWWMLRCLRDHALAATA